MAIVSSIIRRAVKILKSYRFHSFRFIIGCIAVAVFEVVSLGALLPIINHILDNTKSPNYVIHVFNNVCVFLGLPFNLASYLIIFLGTSICATIIYLLIQFDKGLLLRKLEYSLKTNLFGQIINSKWKNISKLQDGKLLNSLTRELDACVKTDELLLVSISQIILIIFSTSFLISINFNLTLSFFAITAVVYIFIYPIIKIGNSISKNFIHHNAVYAQSIINVLNSVKNIKSMSLEKSLQKAIQPVFDNVIKYNLLLISIFTPFRCRVIEFLGMVVLCSLIYFSFAVLEVPPSELLLILAVLLKLIPTLSQFYNSLSSISCGMASYEYLEDVLNSCGKVESVKVEKNLPELQSLELRELSFAYPGNPQLFKNVNVTFRKGEFWAICGKTGAGKSTLLDIIAKLTESSVGQLFYNSMPYEEITNDELHKKVGYLTQQHFIFEGTLLDNITWGLEGYSEERLKKSLKIAQLTDLVNEKGLDYPVLSGGKNLSGGQNQRIGIARILIRNYDFILLDEPTSSLDQKTELAFFEGLKTLKEDICLILITHKEEFLNHVDFILDHRDETYTIRK